MSKMVLNALGEPLFYSGSSTGFFSATDSGPKLHGTDGNDSMWGDSSVDVTMIGGSGDDIYYLYSGINRAHEDRDEGVDTIHTWMSYTLPDNFENLTVTGDGRHAFGNDADNVISGASGSQTINGGMGNDALIGGGDSDVFLVTQGDGSDLITDFGADDIVRLNGYGMATFNEVRSHMTENGDDVRLDLGNGESLVFDDTKVADFHSGQFQLSLDRSNLTQTFSDNFSSLRLSDGSGHGWEPTFWWAPDHGATLPDNGELQWYIDPTYAPTASANPFTVDDGILTITAKATPDGIGSQIGDYDYVSGMLTTHSSFAQTYGYFEIRADMPDEQGAWPAFWLLPEDGSWPPELDVVEMRGQDQKTVHVTVHSNDSGNHTIESTAVDVPSTDGFHTYGVLWQPDEIVWYFDDVAVAHADTPADMDKPMYMLVNLAVGGPAGQPDGELANGSEMRIDYIRAYSLDHIEGSDSAMTLSHSAGSDWHI